MATNLTKMQRCDLAVEVYEVMLASTESFEEEDRVGPDLAYLMAAILKDSYCEWPTDRPILNLMREHLKVSPAWQFVKIEPSEEE